MENTGFMSANRSSHKFDTATGWLKGWPALFACILLIWVVIFHIGPWLDRHPSIQPLVKFIDEQNIDAGALYYTEIEEFSEADIQMNHTMDFMPHGP